MARQTIPSNDPIFDPVRDDLDTFFLPFDSSLDLTGVITGGEARTTYGVTDPAVEVSMVNVRHLKAYTQFRGVHVPSPGPPGPPGLTNLCPPKLPLKFPPLACFSFSFRSEVSINLPPLKLPPNPSSPILSKKVPPNT